MWDRSHVLVRRLDPCQNYVNHKIRQTSKAPGMCRTRVSQSNHGAYPSVDGERLNILSSPIQQYHSDPCFLTCTFEITSPPCRDMHMVVAKQALVSLIRHGWFLLSFAKSDLNLPGGMSFHPTRVTRQCERAEKTSSPKRIAFRANPSCPVPITCHDLRLLWTRSQKTPQHLGRFAVRQCVPETWQVEDNHWVLLTYGLVSWSVGDGSDGRAMEHHGTSSSAGLAN